MAALLSPMMVVVSPAAVAVCRQRTRERNKSASLTTADIAGILSKEGQVAASLSSLFLCSSLMRNQVVHNDENSEVEVRFKKLIHKSSFFSLPPGKGVRNPTYSIRYSSAWSSLSAPNRWIAARYRFAAWAGDCWSISWRSSCLRIESEASSGGRELLNFPMVGGRCWSAD